MTVKIEWGRLTDAQERMCDGYCKWPSLSESQEALDNHCNDCPLNNINCEEYWTEQDRD